MKSLRGIHNQEIGVFNQQQNSQCLEYWASKTPKALKHTVFSQNFNDIIPVAPNLQR